MMLFWVLKKLCLTVKIYQSLIEIQSYNKNKTLKLLKRLGFKIVSSRGKNFILKK